MRGAVAIGGVLLLAACQGGVSAQSSRAAGAPSYDGIQTRLLDGDLVAFDLTMRGGDGNALSDYADCAAAQYALIRGYGFARHIRTTTTQAGPVTRADAVYTISDALPEGSRTLDAETTVAACATSGIPTV